MYHALFILSPFVGHLCYSYLLTIMNGTAMNMGIKIPLQDPLSVLLNPKVKLLNHMIVLVFFKTDFKYFSSFS
jgi:hypothetical protein